MLDHINVGWFLSLWVVDVWILLLLWRPCWSSSCVFAMHNWKHSCCKLLCIAPPSWVFHRMARSSTKGFTMHMHWDFNGFGLFCLWNPWSHTWGFQALCNTLSYACGAHAWACTCWSCFLFVFIMMCLLMWIMFHIALRLHFLLCRSCDWYQLCVYMCVHICVHVLAFAHACASCCSPFATFTCMCFLWFWLVFWMKSIISYMKNISTCTCTSTYTWCTHMVMHMQLSKIKFHIMCVVVCVHYDVLVDVDHHPYDFEITFLFCRLCYLYKLLI